MVMTDRLMCVMSDMLPYAVRSRYLRVAGGTKVEAHAGFSPCKV